MTHPVSLERRDEIAIVTVDHPPVNALSHSVREGIVRHVRDADADDSVRAIILVCAGRTFIAGADITEFGKPPQDPTLSQMLEVLDNTGKLTLAAIHGTALGGGLETAMCCHYRIANATARLGLPESKLGLLPGAGGTQRLPRLIGAPRALDMMVTGEPISAASAQDAGLIDHIHSGNDLLGAAVRFARQLIGDRAPLRRARDLEVPAVADDFIANAVAMVAERARGFEAPRRIVQCVEAAISEPFARGMTIERELFTACMASTQSAAMRHLFFAERAAAKVPGIGPGVQAHSIETVGIIGAGTMGAGIALACMNANLPVTLLDSSKDSLARGAGTIAKLLDKQVDKGRISAELRDSRMELLTTSSDYDVLSNTDLVIEAVFEDMAVKHEVFKTLDRVCRDGAILATNTSTLDVDEIARGTSRPQDVIGLHFFSPAHIMRLLEIVRGSATSPALVASALKFAKQIGKLGVVVGNCFGFVGNRMLYGYGRENQLMLLEGAAPQAIDKALTDWGMAMGPNAVGDLAGLDVGYKVRQARADKPTDSRYYRVADLLAEQGRYGQKTGAGIYRYEKGSRAPIPDPTVQAMIRAEAQRLRVPQRAIGSNEITERCIFALIVEGARILEEGIATRASDIDVVWANGYGFPRYRGGPMFYADTLGLEQVAHRVREFATRFGEQYWSVPPLLDRLAQDGGKFAQLEANA